MNADVDTLADAIADRLAPLLEPRPLPPIVTALERAVEYEHLDRNPVRVGRRKLKTSNRRARTSTMPARSPICSPQHPRSTLRRATTSATFRGARSSPRSRSPACGSPS